MMSVPTGWTGDAPVYSKTGMPNEEMTPFY